MERFLAALHGELELVGNSGWAARVTVGSVFLGGGTPSLLEADALAGILDRLGRRLELSPGAEVTVEANPESVRRETLEGYRRAGVNRLSLGVQSLEDHLLARLGRLHSPLDARRAFDDARAAGFDNVSVDLMYGLPGLDLSGWEHTVRTVLSWRPDHLSAYGLTLDEGSRWASEGVTDLPEEEDVVAQYWLLARLAREAGYEHYEISNYCRPGRAARHNLVYWRAGEYVGLGPGACGFLGDVRYRNVKPPERYAALLELGKSPVGDWERLTEAERRCERLMLGLRLAEGVPSAWLEERARLAPHRLPRLLQIWQARGLLVIGTDRARLTEAGFLLSDALFVELPEPPPS
jgi:oxygen-independent coproporphyrinogen-3 oxidase